MIRIKQILYTACKTVQYNKNVNIRLYFHIHFQCPRAWQTNSTRFSLLPAVWRKCLSVQTSDLRSFSLWVRVSQWPSVWQVVHTYMPLSPSSIRTGRRMVTFFGWDVMAESNGSLPPGLWLKKSPMGWLPVHRDQLRAQRSVTSTAATKNSGTLSITQGALQIGDQSCKHLLHFRGTGQIQCSIWSRSYKHEKKTTKNHKSQK